MLGSIATRRFGVLPVTSNINLFTYSPLLLTPSLGSSFIASASVASSAGWNVVLGPNYSPALDTSGSVIDLPFTFNYLGTAYTRVSVGSDNIICFGNDNVILAGPSFFSASVPGFNKIFFNGGNGSIGGIYTKISNLAATVRLELYNTSFSTGTKVVTEWTFFNPLFLPVGTATAFQLVTGTYAAPTSTTMPGFSVCDASSVVAFSNISILSNSSYVIRMNSLNSWNIDAGYSYRNSSAFAAGNYVYA